MNNLPLIGGAGGGLLLLIIVLIVVMRKRKKSSGEEGSEAVEETPDEVYSEEASEGDTVEGLNVEYNQDNHNIISVKLNASFPFTVNSITPEESKYYTLFGLDGIVGRHMSLNKNFKVFLDKTDEAKTRESYSFKLAINFSKEDGTYNQMLYVSKKNRKSEAKITNPKAA